jgi:hypothetical protein
MVPSAEGNIRSRPILKLTREEARTLAFKADMVEKSPPKTMRATPNSGIKFSAARTMPVSLNTPRISHEVLISGSLGSRASLIPISGGSWSTALP